jgi:hypothetical protein
MQRIAVDLDKFHPSQGPLGQYQVRLVADEASSPRMISAGVTIRDLSRGPARIEMPSTEFLQIPRYAAKCHSGHQNF